MFSVYMIFLILKAVKCEECCSNEELSDLDCEKLHLSYIPNCRINSKIENLLLGFNKITILRNSSNKAYGNIKELKLNNNKMKIIQIGAFEDFKNLKKLYLNNNLLTHLPSILFSNLLELKYIYLHHNKFLIIPDISNGNIEILYFGNNLIESIYFPDSYLNCKKLRKIFLKNNDIKYANLSAMENLRNSELQVISFNNNHLENVSTNILYPIRKHLRFLDIGNNPKLSKNFEILLHSFDHTRFESSWHLEIVAFNIGLAEISRHTFISLINISVIKLDLSKNYISTLINDWRTLKKLSKLKLNNNVIKKINNFQFYGLQKLKTLEMSSNLIYYIHENSFQNLSLLRHLDLSYNKISSLNILAFIPLLSLKDLLINGNRFIVLRECMIYRDHNFIFQNNQIIKYNNLTSAALCFENFKCPKSLTKRIGFAFKIDKRIDYCLVFTEKKLRYKTAGNLTNIPIRKLLNQKNYKFFTFGLGTLTIFAVFIIAILIFINCYRYSSKKKKKCEHEISDSENVYELISDEIV